MADAYAKAKAAVGDLVDERRRLGEIVRVASVHVGDAGAEWDLVGGEGQRCAKRQVVGETRAVNPVKAFLLQAFGRLERRLPASRHGDHADGWFARHRFDPLLMGCVLLQYL